MARSKAASHSACPSSCASLLLLAPRPGGSWKSMGGSWLLPWRRAAATAWKAGQNGRTSVMAVCDSYNFASCTAATVGTCSRMDPPSSSDSCRPNNWMSNKATKQPRAHLPGPGCPPVPGTLAPQPGRAASQSQPAGGQTRPALVEWYVRCGLIDGNARQGGVKQSRAGTGGNARMQARLRFQLERQVN